MKPSHVLTNEKLLTPGKILIVMCLLFTVLLTGCARAGGEPAQYTFNQPALLGTKDAVSQTIMPHGDVISAIDVIALELDSSVDPQGRLQIIVHDISPDSPPNTLSSVFPYESTWIQGSDIKTGWVTFTFEPPITAPELALLQITWTGKTKLGLGVNTTPVNRNEQHHPLHNPYAHGKAFVGDTELAGDLAFRVQGDKSLRALASQSYTAVTTWVHRLLGHKRFFAIWFTLLLGSFAMIIWGKKR